MVTFIIVANMPFIGARANTSASFKILKNPGDLRQRPTGEGCHTSTSTPSIALPFVSTTTHETNRSWPGACERTIEAPFKDCQSPQQLMGRISLLCSFWFGAYANAPSLKPTTCDLWIDSGNFNESITIEYPKTPIVELNDALFS